MRCSHTLFYPGCDSCKALVGGEIVYYNGTPPPPKLIKTGTKHDQAKPALDLIPTEFLLSVGSVLSFGAQKYDRANWAKGIEYSRLISAALRHLAAFNNGEDRDPESGISHLGHAGCNLAFLTWMTEHRPDLDNRWIKLVKEKK